MTSPGSPDLPRSDTAARSPAVGADPLGAARDDEADPEEPVTPTESQAEKNMAEDPPA